MGAQRSYRRTIELPASPEVVFWDLLEPGHVAEYDSRMRSWVPREVPPAVGTRVDFVARVFGMWGKATSEFVAFDPPRHLKMKLVRPPTPLRSRLTWDLAPSPTGTTFEYRFEMEGPAGLGWLAGTLLRSFTSHLDRDLPALAQRYE